MVKDFKGVLNGNVSVELGDQVYEVLDSSSNKDKSINQDSLENVGKSLNEYLEFFKGLSRGNVPQKYASLVIYV